MSNPLFGFSRTVLTYKENTAQIMLCTLQILLQGYLLQNFHKRSS